MPNYVKNIVRMNGIAKMPLYNENGEFDFNRIVPMPKEIDETQADFNDEELVLYYITNRGMYDVTKEQAKYLCSLFSCDEKQLQSIKARMKTLSLRLNQEDKQKSFESGKERLRLYKKYGVANWYTWSIINWGTKWNAIASRVIDEDTIEFETAWSDPREIMIALSNMYPDKEIKHWYADEDEGCNADYVEYENGNSCSNHTINESKLAHKLYEVCWFDPSGIDELEIEL